MPSIISAGTTTGTALNLTGDTSGELQIQTNNGATTALTLTTGGAATFTAGTVSAPAITTAGDTNTGIFFPAADTIAFSEGGVESMRIDTSGNVGIGTNNPLAKLHVTVDGGEVRNQGDGNFYSLYKTDGTATGFLQGNADNSITLGTYAGDLSIRSIGAFPVIIATNNTERMRIDSSGNVGIGTSSPRGGIKLDVASTGESIIAITDLDQANTYGTIGHNGGLTQFLSRDGSSFGQFIWYGFDGTLFPERMRITSSGEFLVGKALSDVATAGFRVLPSGITYSSITTGSGSTYHMYNTTTSAFGFYVLANGGVANFSGNDVNLSDERTKTNIEVAGSYLDKICSIPVKLFNYKDEAKGEQRTLGVIAQDVEAVAPEFVNNDGWQGTEPEDGVPLKTIYTTDMMFGMMKAIQEQQTLIENLTTRLNALEGN
jgi:hypothetical protein